MFLNRIEEKKLGKRPGSIKMEEEGLKPQTLHKIYHKLKVLEQNYLAVYNLAAFGNELTCLLCTVINIFAAIVYGDVRSLVRAGLFMVLTKIYFNKLSQIYSESETAIESWKVREVDKWIENGNGGHADPGRFERIWMRKFLRHCQPLRIRIGSFFFIDKTFLLTIFSIIFEQTTNLTLSYK